MSIPPNAVRIIPFHYIIVIPDCTVGAGFKPARIIAASVATRRIAAYAIGSFVCQALCPHPDTAIMQLARSPAAPRRASLVPESTANQGLARERLDLKEIPGF